MKKNAAKSGYFIYFHIHWNAHYMCIKSSGHANGTQTCIHPSTPINHSNTVEINGTNVILVEQINIYHGTAMVCAPAEAAFSTTLERVKMTFSSVIERVEMVTENAASLGLQTV